MTQPRSGFTLLEVVLVLALMVMILAMAYPAFDSWYADVRLNAGADHLRAKFAEARSHAIDEGRPYRFAVMPGQSDYRLAPDSPEFWGDSNAAPADAAEDGSSPPLVKEDRLPSNINFNLGQGAGTSDSSGWVTILTFLPDGTCDADKSIRLDLEGTRPVEIQVRELTGSVTVRTVPLGEAR